MSTGNGTKATRYTALVKELGNLGMGFAALLFAFGLLAYKEHVDGPIERQRIELLTNFSAVVSKHTEAMQARTELERAILKELERLE